MQQPSPNQCNSVSFQTLVCTTRFTVNHTEHASDAHTSFPLHNVLQMHNVQNGLQVLVRKPLLSHGVNAIWIDNLVPKCTNGHVGSAGIQKHCIHICVYVSTCDHCHIGMYVRTYVCTHTIYTCIDNLLYN